MNADTPLRRHADTFPPQLNATEAKQGRFAYNQNSSQMDFKYLSPVKSGGIEPATA
jgi:hypothetical protein